MPSGFVYMLASKPYGTLYIGVTSKLFERMEQHRVGRGSEFVEKHGVKRLVWFEEFPLYVAAVQRETSLKRWKRAWKIELIEKTNLPGRTCWRIGTSKLDGRVKPGHGD